MPRIDSPELEIFSQIRLIFFVEYQQASRVEGMYKTMKDTFSSEFIGVEQISTMEICTLSL